MIALRASALVSTALASCLLAGAAASQARNIEEMRVRVNEHYRVGNYAAAFDEAKRLEAAVRNQFGAEHLHYATALNVLAKMMSDTQGMHAEAETLYRRVKAIYERALANRLAPAEALQNTIAETVAMIGSQQLRGGKYADAEESYKRSLPMLERAATPAVCLRLRGVWVNADPCRLTNETLASYIDNLGALYVLQGRYSEGEALHRRALEIFERMSPINPAHVAGGLDRLATVKRQQGDYAQAEKYLKRAIEIFEKEFGSSHVVGADYVNSYGMTLRLLGQYKQAEELHKRALASFEGKSDYHVAEAELELGRAIRGQGHFSEAEKHLRRALGFNEQAGGERLAETLNELAVHFSITGDVTSALTFSRRASVAVADRRSREGSDAMSAETYAGYFRNHVVSLAVAAQKGLETTTHAMAEAFEIAQRSNHSRAASALQQTAVRIGSGSGALSTLVRERQDLEQQRSAKNKLLIELLSQVESKQNRPALYRLRKDIRDIEGRMTTIGADIRRDFPDYEGLARPQELKLADTQKLLAPEEALVLFLDDAARPEAPESTFIWVVTKDDARWVRSALGTAALTEKVAALRCGLDEEEWTTLSKAAACGKRLGMSQQPAPSDVLPFDLKIAHELYQALFGEVEDLIKGKRLLLVPSGPLTSLPFQVLVTKAPIVSRPTSFADYRPAAWLGRAHALTVLPAVSSLKALREQASRGMRAREDYIGYGDPLLRGNRDACRAAKVPDRCPDRGVAGSTLGGDAGGRATVRGRGNRRSAGLSDVFAKGRNSAAVLEHVRALCPLPDTAYEIKCVAKGFRTEATTIRLDRLATETDLKALNRSGGLANYRILHFATHGLLAGDVEVMAKRQGEPALVLTPPDKPRDKDDDGLLTASEIAELKLNADWVVLSACNTAAGDRLTTEALSGLARSFFYAGAKGLLVSHWPVYSDAAVRITSSAFAHLESNPKAGRAEALQHAMVELMSDGSEEDNAHPAVWAPFVVVGEGAR